MTTKGTAWGLLNDFTQYVDHDKPTRTDDARLALKIVETERKRSEDF
ncbi:DUF932 domain-containing protein [Methylomonas sp. AM2-LC]